MSTTKSCSADYPVVLDLKERQVTVIGAGQVGQRKIRGLLKAGARVRIIDPAPIENLDTDRLEHIQREYRSGDLAGSILVFICSNNPSVNQQAADEATDRSIWYNRSDSAAATAFTLPAVLRRGQLTIAVSTGGGSPAMASLIRDKIAENIPDSWGKAVEIIAAIRRKWLTEETEVQYNQEVLRYLLDKELLPLITHGQVENIDRLLLSRFGPGYSLDELQVQPIKGAS